MYFSDFCKNNAESSFYIATRLILIESCFFIEQLFDKHQNGLSKQPLYRFILNKKANYLYFRHIKISLEVL